MNKLSLDQLRQLYSVYSPLTSSNHLYKKYIEITGDTYQSIESIRKKYNKVIIKGFLNETVIKTSFIKKYCIKKSPKKTVTIFELNIAGSRADLCIVNGNSIVFEIKTEFDNYLRLKKQISDYEKTIEYINIIIPESSLDSIITNIDSKIGIITYKQINKNIIFNIYKEPSFNFNIDSRIQLNQLTLSQLKGITRLNSSKENIINELLRTKSKEEINQLYILKITEKYRKQWKFLLDNKNKIHPLDYQWFFKNNLSTRIVYK